MKATGDISPPFETEFGTHILRLVSRTDASVEPFDFVKDGIAEKLAGESLNAVRSKFFSDLRAANPVFHEDMIEVVRKRYGELPKMSGQPVAPSAQAAEGTK